MGCYKIDETTAYYICPRCAKEHTILLDSLDMIRDSTVVFPECDECGTRLSVFCSDILEEEQARIPDDIFSRITLHHTLYARLVSKGIKPKKARAEDEDLDAKFYAKFKRLAKTDNVVTAKIHPVVKERQDARKAKNNSR